MSADIICLPTPLPSPAPFKIRDNSDLIGTIGTLAKNFADAYSDPNANPTLIESSCNSLVCTLALLQQRMIHEHDRMREHIHSLFNRMTPEDQRAVQPKLCADVDDICRSIASALAVWRDMALAVIGLMEQRGLPPNSDEWKGLLH